MVIWLIPRTYGALLWSAIAMNSMLVVGSTVAGALMVEVGQKFGATGRLTSARYFVQSACILLSGPIGGYLATRPFRPALTGGLSALSVTPIAFWLIEEPAVAKAAGKAWINTKRRFNTLIHTRMLWAAAGLVFLVYISPGFATPLYHFQTDTLKLSRQFIGTLILLNGIFALLGSFIYGLLCTRLS
jgi:hypothetical protein